MIYSLDLELPYFKSYQQLLKRSNNGRMYKTSEYDVLYLAIKRQINGIKLNPDKFYKVSMEFLFKPVKNQKYDYPTRLDLDNLYKLIQDIVFRILEVDDRRVVEAKIVKNWNTEDKFNVDIGIMEV